MKNAFGSYLVLESTHAPSTDLPVRKQGLMCEQLQLLYGVGPATEIRLKEAGYETLVDLQEHPRWGQQAREILACVEQADIRGMRRLGARDMDILPYFCREDIVYLDIETTGLWSTQPLFLVGLLYYHEGQLRSRQLLARNLQEEKPLLAGLIEDLARFSMIVTYNGRNFDIPYIENRTVAHRLFYRSSHEQIDLLYHARRHFRGVLPDCRLVTLEEHLLGKKREDDIPGYLIPATYYRYVRTRDAKLLSGILEHNRDDLLAMEGMMPLVTTAADASPLLVTGQFSNGGCSCVEDQEGQDYHASTHSLLGADNFLKNEQRQNNGENRFHRADQSCPGGPNHLDTGKKGDTGRSR